MDKVSLALFGKINKMYAEGKDDKYIAFNQAAVPWEADTLNQQLHNLTNVPLKVTPIREVTGRDNYLWTPYRETLQHCDSASSTWDEDEWQAFENKTQQLDKLEPLYMQYKKAYDDLKAELRGEEIALDNLQDDELRAEKEIRVQELDEFVQDALRDWKTKGKKLQYENLENQIIGSAPEYPVKVIQKYLSDMEAAVMGGDPGSGQEVYSTYLLPGDFFIPNSKSGWIDFDLDKKEVDSLYNYAINTVFKDVKDLVKPNANDDQLEIERISGEIGTLEVVRNWLNPNFFYSKYWRLPSIYASEYLSDGVQNQPKGRIPGYVTRFIFLRKLDIELKANSNTNKETIEKNQKKETPIVFGNMILRLPPKQNAKNINNLSKALMVNSKVAKNVQSNALKYLNSSKKHRFNTLQMKVNLSSFIKANYQQLKGASLTKMTNFSTRSTTAADIKPKARTSLTGKPVVAGIGRKSGLTGITSKVNVNLVNTISKVSVTTKPPIIGTVTAIPKFGFEGVVKSEDGSPLKNVALVFNDTINTQKTYTVKTNNQGAFKVNLPAGPYRVEIDHDGFFRYVKKLPYRKGAPLKSHKINISLNKNPEAEIEDQFSFVFLASLCQRLPKAPNPDQSLPWDMV